MAAETGFLINGDLYEVPTLDSFDNDECHVFYEYCGLAQEDFIPQEGETEDETSERNQAQMKHPGFWQALMYIAYRRRHPDVKPAKLRELIGSVNRMDALSRLGSDPVEEDDVVPPVLTSEPDRSSLSGSLESDSSNENRPVSGGEGSTDGSDGQVVPLASTGTIR